MGTYSDTKSFEIPNSLDEVGLTLGLQRLEGEDLDTYRRRLLLEARLPTDADLSSYVRGASRQVGLFDEPVFEVDLVLDVNGDPLAADPYIEITSTRIRAYSDYANATLDFELAIERETNWFVDDLYNALVASANYSVSIIAADYQYKLLNKLQTGNTMAVKDLPVPNRSAMNNLDAKYIRMFQPSDTLVFATSQASQAAVVADGDYYLDTTNGVVFTYTDQAGDIMLQHADFPWKIREAGVRVVEASDPDLRYRTHTKAIDEQGLRQERNKLTPFGGWLTDEVYKISPTGWGK